MIMDLVREIELAKHMRAVADYAQPMVEQAIEWSGVTTAASTMLDIYGNIQLENYTAVAPAVGKGVAELGTKKLEKALDAAKAVKKVDIKPKDVKLETKRQALRQAKRDAGIPTSQTHKTHIKKVVTDRAGGRGTDLVFENGKTVQHHKTGHNFQNDPKPPHFNNHPDTKNHYIYDR
jgi:hypothetical protein